MAVQRISVLNVPVDIIQPEEIETELLALLDKPGAKQIIFLSIWDLLYARLNTEYLVCLEKADLVLPISKSILSGARFLKQKIPVRYNPFTAVIQVLGILESHYKSLYMLGSSKKTLQKAESNLRATFPQLRIVGRCVGYYSKNIEDDIVQAIYKAQPSLVLMSEGIKEKNVWAWKRRNRFSSSIFVYYKDAFGIFSEKIKRVNERTFAHGNEIFVEIAKNPLKVFLIFPYIGYIIKLAWYKFVKN